MRWLTPPPTRTAYFCSARRPGSVLRLSRIWHSVPSTASTQAAVAVAMPDRWQTRLSMVRSAVSRPRVGATTVSTDCARRDPGAVGDRVGDLVVHSAEHLVEHEQSDVEARDGAVRA